MTEKQTFRNDPELVHKIRESYKMMLGFYGMQFVDEDSGTLERSDSWREQLANLNYNSHNYLRISRILKCLGEMNLEHLKAPWIKFLTQEVLEHRTIPNAEDSLVRFWISTLRNETQRTEALNLVHDLRNPLKKNANVHEPENNNDGNTPPTPPTTTIVTPSPMVSHLSSTLSGFTATPHLTTASVCLSTKWPSSRHTCLRTHTSLQHGDCSHRTVAGQ
eukprot:c12517_g1_i2.p1 GENE.c12517_g1_i2~~c12517_g1_i2.p1  ORF type:complete len:219 (+),score=39.44 c12517_g1_i2:635-1291(+)